MPRASLRPTLAALLLATASPTPAAASEDDGNLRADLPAVVGTINERINAEVSDVNDATRYRFGATIVWLTMFIDAYSDPSACYRFTVENPVGSGEDVVIIDIEIPIAALGENTLSAELDVTLIDADGSGTASIVRRNGFPGLQRALLFADDAIEILADLGQVDLVAPGSQRFELSAGLGPTTSEAGILDLIMTFELSEGDVADFRGRVVLDEGTDLPICAVPLLFDGFESGDVSGWSSVVEATDRVLRMVGAMDGEGFGHCSNT